MAGKNANTAFRNYIEPVQEALQCITLRRLSRPAGARLALNVPYSIALNDMDPVPLKSPHRLQLTIGQQVRLIRTEPNDERGPIRVTTISYFYAFSASVDGVVKEVLAFQWTPEATGGSAVTFPHLHIGPALLVGQSAIRPSDLHRAHIPTGRVSLEAVVRLAITEFGVTPLQARWAEILRRTEDAFMTWRSPERPRPQPPSG